MPRYSKVASGNIAVSTFVILDSSNIGQVLQATGNTVPLWGVAQAGQRNPPWNIGGVAVLDGNAAINQEALWIYGAPMLEVLLNIGGTVTVGDYLTSNGSGQGITTTTTGQFIGAQAMESGVSGDTIKVRVLESYPY